MRPSGKCQSLELVDIVYHRIDKTIENSFYSSYLMAVEIQLLDIKLVRLLTLLAVSISLTIDCLGESRRSKCLI